MNSTATQRAQDKTVTSDQSREAADRLAVERGEDDGMIMHQDVTASASTLTTGSGLFNFLKGMSPGVDADPARSAIGARR